LGSTNERARRKDEHGSAHTYIENWSKFVHQLGRTRQKGPRR
jgi:hypothetical protein